MTPVGLEPTTQWLRVICSTNWATESFKELRHNQHPLPFCGAKLPPFSLLSKFFTLFYPNFPKFNQTPYSQLASATKLDTLIINKCFLLVILSFLSTFTSLNHNNWLLRYYDVLSHFLRQILKIERRQKSSQFIEYVFIQNF